MDHFSLKNKTILITGASSGIGSATSILCSEFGANIILLGRNSERLSLTMSKLDQSNHAVVICDLADIESIESAISGTIEKYGKVDGFVHSAGIDMTLPLNVLRPGDYQKSFAINVFSGFEIARVLSKKQFCPVTGASYIFLASVMGVVGSSAKIAYSSGKGALISGCRSMALELSPKKIRVNCISPAIVRTELVNRLFSELPAGSEEAIESKHPLGFGMPGDVASACVYLLSDEARWITGSNLVIDGGYSCQ